MHPGESVHADRVLCCHGQFLEAGLSGGLPDGRRLDGKIVPPRECLMAISQIETAENQTRFARFSRIRRIGPGTLSGSTSVQRRMCVSSR